jgi:site-specific recombinase XerC
MGDHLTYKNGLASSALALGAILYPVHRFGFDPALYCAARSLLPSLLDWLVTGRILATNPAHAVRGPKHVVKTGKTTVLTGEQARELLDSIDTSTLVGLRDRALISAMTFAFARIGAVVAMRVEDYYPKGKRWRVRLHEKGGKRHEMPAHHNLEAYLDAYIEAAGSPAAAITRGTSMPARPEALFSGR